MLTTVLDDLFSCLGGYFEIISSVGSYISLRQDMCIFDVFDIKITFKLHPSCLNQCTWWLCRRLTREYRAKYEQLESGEFGSPGTPAFDAEACELANLLVHVSQLCQKLNLLTPKELYRPTFFKALKTLFGSKLIY